MPGSYRFYCVLNADLCDMSAICSDVISLTDVFTPQSSIQNTSESHDWRKDFLDAVNKVTTNVFVKDIINQAIHKLLCGFIPWQYEVHTLHRIIA